MKILAFLPYDSKLVKFGLSTEAPPAWNAFPSSCFLPFGFVNSYLSFRSQSGGRYLYGVSETHDFELFLYKSVFCYYTVLACLFVILPGTCQGEMKESQSDCLKKMMSFAQNIRELNSNLGVYLVGKGKTHI